MKKIILVFIFCFFFYSHSSAFAFGSDVFSDSTKTIRELRQDLKEYELTEKSVEQKLQEFLENTPLESMIRKNLTHDEIKAFETYIHEYLKQKELIERVIQYQVQKDIIEAYQKKLIENKIDFYKSIIHYIKKDSYDDYIDYIRGETIIQYKRNAIKL